jgi:hypothetical protein
MIYNRSLKDFFNPHESDREQLIPFLLARNALNYLINSLKIKSIIIPVFICPMVVDIFKNSGVRIYFYSNLDNNLEVPLNQIIDLVLRIESNEKIFFLWHDYLNITGDMPDKLYELLDTKNIEPIIDASHSLPSKYYKSKNVVFGFRKLLNEPFGALLRSRKEYVILPTELPKIKLFKFIMAHKFKTNILLMYKDYDNDLVHYFLKKIINLLDFYSFDKKNYFINNCYTHFKILNIHKKLNYLKISSVRKQNFLQYCKKFPENLNLNNFDTSSPYGFPLFTNNAKELRSRLWNKGIHSFLLWDQLHEDASECNDMSSDYLSKSILILPVNQDLTTDAMNKISEIINEE